MDSLINIGLYLAYLLLTVAALGTVVFALAQIFGNLKNAKNGLIGFAMLVAVLVISYALSPAETGAFYDKHHVSPGLSKLIGGGLLATFILIIGVVGSIIFSEIAKWFK
jgi:hypothetical protein